MKKKVHFNKNQGNKIKIESVYPLLIIINNLLANAVEAIGREGEIKVHASLAETHLMIKVIDNGSGITDEEKDVIFEPGYTTKFDENGRASSGIGLSHVKSMVSELGGTIQVQSKIGFTTFVVCLPLNTIQAKE